MEWNADSGRIRTGLLAMFTALLSGCGGSAPDSASIAGTGSTCVRGDAANADACGTVVVALTDVEGEFLSYTVDVVSVSLTRSTGERVELLPQAARIDFAQLTALSEIVSSSLVAPGDFVGGRIRIDYSDAEIHVEAGGDIVPAQIFAGDGRRLTTDGADSLVDVEIRLPETQGLSIRRGDTAMLSIDFDLAASHLVDTSSTPVTAVAQPYFIAEVQPVDEKELRIRGALAGVDIDAGTYSIQLRPWYHRDGDYGAVTVVTTPSTAFEIDGMAFTGSAGLETLATLPPGTPTVAFGTVSLVDRSFTAEVVHAGTSVEGSLHSAVLGNIVARRGDRLIMKGAVAIRRDRRAHFQHTVAVDIGPDTVVTRQSMPDAMLDTGALSVGQRALVFGEIADPIIAGADSVATDSALVLDATKGRARMLVTRLSGRVTNAVPGLIELELRAIDRMSSELFDFSGTGAPGFDADPLAYEVATSTLPIDAIVIDKPVRVLGFVTAFGAAPPDFEGRAVIGHRDLPATIGVGWGTGGTRAPFASMGSDNLVIDLSNPDIGSRHHMLIGYELIDLNRLPASPPLVESQARRVYGIWEPGHIELFKDFGDFVDELALRLSNTDRAHSLAAYGRYGEFNNTLSANKIVVHMTPAETP